MKSAPAVGLPDALERAAGALPELADGIRPANGDPDTLRETLGPEGSARVLAWLLEHEPEAGAELASAWAEDPQAAAAVLAVDASALPKAGRKVLRRVRHRLRSRGVAVPETPRPGGVVRLPPVDETVEAAVVSPLDPTGARIAYLVEPNPAGGVRLFQIVLEGDRGVGRLEVFRAPRGRARRLLRDLTRAERFASVSAEPDAVRALVKRAAERHPRDRPFPRGFDEFRSRLTSAPEGARTPGEEVRAALGGEGGDARDAEKLVAEGQVGPWPPPPEVLRPLADRIAEVARGRVIVSEARRSERVASAVDEAAGELLAGEAGSRTAELFEESAYVFWKSGSEAEARACLAAARAFREDAPVARTLARKMLELVLAPLLRRLEEEAQQEGSEGSEPAGESDEAASSPIVKP